MDFTRYFSSESILAGIAPVNKWALIETMVDALMDAYPFRDHAGVDRQTVLDAVVKREKEKPTVLGHGLACPHARIPELRRVGVAIALLRDGMAFDDGHERVRVAVLVVVPSEQQVVLLKLIGRLAGLAQNSETWHAFQQLHSAAQVYEFLRDLDLDIDEPLRARDIMRAPRVFIEQDTPLPQVTQAMQRLNLDAISVVDQDHRLVGEITCDNLFTLGIPDFFSQLKSVSFINEYDPFEKYFPQASLLTARDVMSQNYAALPEDATLLEVVFLLAVRRHPKVYVVRDGKTVGIIDRILVLDRIVNM